MAIYAAVRWQKYVMKELVKREGVASDWEIESAAVSREEIGNPVYPPARRKLLEQGIPCGQHRGAADDVRRL